MDAPCEPWPIDTSCWDLPEGGDHSALIEKWQAVASALLWRLSGRRWGTCVITVRPCRADCGDSVGGGVQPYVYRGRWYNSRGCGCTSDACSCGAICEVRLPGPVSGIESVQVDGAVLEPEAYRVDNGDRLVRQDGGCWPDCQDMAAPDGEVGTFSVTYLRGIDLDESAIQAVSAYTYEFVKACKPECGDCELPKRVTQVVRQNVAAQFIDPQTYLQNGLTGLEYIDQWIRSVNPNALPQAPRVLSPDYQPEPRRTTWTAAP